MEQTNTPTRDHMAGDGPPYGAPSGYGSAPSETMAERDVRVAREWLDGSTRLHRRHRAKISALVGLLASEVERLRFENEQLRLLSRGSGGDSHRCVACGFEYTPQDGESEDCPECGCDGTLPSEPSNPV